MSLYRHRLDADPDPDFHYNADPYPDPDWHQNAVDRHADPSPSFTHVKNRGKTYCYFPFLISGKGVILKLLEKSQKYMCLELKPIRISRIRQTMQI
jgi:hypothetical protein